MHLTLHLTDACNLRCTYCYVRQDTHAMTPDTAKAAIDLAAADPGHHGIIFFGGEPLLQRQLIYDTVYYAEALGLPGKFHYKITTNGTLLDQEFLEFSKQHQVFIALSHDEQHRISAGFIRMAAAPFSSWSQLQGSCCNTVPMPR